MYASRITPVQRMRSSGSTSSGGGGGNSSYHSNTGGRRGSVSGRHSKAVTPSCLGKVHHSTTTPSPRNSWHVGSPSGQVNMNSDYHVLRSTVEQDRMALQEHRVRLASSLDQLGEHHVRQKEYDDAMDAFTEALKEKRSVFWHVTTYQPSMMSTAPPVSTSTLHSRSTNNSDSVHSSSLFSGLNGHGGGGRASGEDESTTFSNKDPAAIDRMEHTQASYDNTVMQERAIDELIATLRNMGNVHSLRGEQDEAMRYYTEVTSLRSKKAAMITASSGPDATESRSLLSSLANDENSAMMSEINEDVKALDDLFRSISFRNQTSTAQGGMNMPATTVAASGDISGPASSGGTPEKRKSLKHTSSNKKLKSSRHVSSSSSDAVVENEPFNRSSSGFRQSSVNRLDDHGSVASFSGPPSFMPAGNEASEAMDMYRAALDNFAGSPARFEQHTEMMNSLKLRCDLLSEKRQKNRHDVLGSPVLNSKGGNSELLPSQSASTKAADLELALEIYRHVLLARQEGQKGLGTAEAPLCPSESSRSSDKSTVSLDGPVLSSTGLVEQASMTSDDKQQQQIAASHIASTLICMGSIYYKLGDRVEELKKYKEAKRVYRKAFGEEHVFVAGTLKNIGMVLAERGEYEEAMSQFEKAMKIYVSVHKKDQEEQKRGSSSPDDESDHEDEDEDLDDSILLDPDEKESEFAGVVNRDVASAISCMGNVKNRTGELEGALEKYMQALKIYKSIYQTARHASPSTAAITEALRDVTSTLKVIGMVHAKRGDLDTAMGFFQEAMQLLREDEHAAVVTSTAGADSHAYGPDDLSASCIRETMASVLTRIASIYLKKNDLDAAMAHYREAYEMTIRNRGTTNHAEVAGILHYIGGIYHKQANYDDAMACYQESIRIYHATLGPGNPTVAGTLVMVGSIHYKRRNLDSAMMFYREALRLNRDAYGMHHPDVAPILKSIGTILTKKGDYQDAYDVFRDVLSIKCTVHGTDHPEVASAYKSLGNVHYKLGDLADAERQYRHALSIYRRCKGEDHADTVAAKTTIEHLRYWMRERDNQREIERKQQQHGHAEQRQGRNTSTVYRGETSREI